MKLFKHKPKKLVEDNKLQSYQELEWEQGPKGILMLKPKRGGNSGI